MVERGVQAYRKSVDRQKQAEAAFRKEKKEAAERLKKQQAELAAMTRDAEQNRLEVWGSIVLSTGFADLFPDGFEKLAGIIIDAVPELGSGSNEKLVKEKSGKGKPAMKAEETDTEDEAVEVDDDEPALEDVAEGDN